MTELANPHLSSWESFYVIVGSSGAALIGLQFVVMTLIADKRALASADSLSAFGTPTVVNLAGALIVSAIMSAPWHTLFAAALTLMLCGLTGIAYSAVVIRRARRQTSYQPVWQDWLWYAVLPCSAYVALAITAAFLSSHTRVALFIVGGAALSLLLIGIHNAWDTVTHIVVSSSHNGATRSR